MRGKRSEFLREILGGLATGAEYFITYSGSAGNRGGIKEIRHALRAKKLRKEWLLSRLYYLRDKELVEFVEDGDNVRIVLTENGRQRNLVYKFDELSINVPPSWDRKWRLVIFDIPETRRRARDALTSKLKELGFMQFNKSAWIFPYECSDEIDFVAEVFEVGRYVHYLVIETMTNTDKLKKLFRL